MNFFENRKLKRNLEQTIEGLQSLNDFSADIKVSVYDLDSRIHSSVSGNNYGWAASIIKVPIMISTLNEIEKGNLSLDTRLEVNHEFMLEPFDYVSRLPDKSSVPVINLMYHMIVESDNEATNILANEVGIDKINKDMKKLGMKNSMLGHLLCPNVPRHYSYKNIAGDNITCPNDMVKIMRHIYDDSFSKLSPSVRVGADVILSKTSPSYLGVGKFRNKNIKAKVGYISDIEAGSDMHEVGIVDNHLIVCVMLNKFKHFVDTEDSLYNLDS
ncbi:MAG: class A beta-lactamase-related serine hydrolase [Candidatus Pacearchaeota archaeon]|nr:class A beta-lactamase-related serine hydrolase [Candidatus Pacearchaeota archaeon]